MYPKVVEIHFPVVIVFEKQAGGSRRLAHVGDMAHELALEVRSFVLMPDTPLGQAVDHAQNFGQKLLSLGFVFYATQVLDRRPGRLLVKAVAKAADDVLANALLCRFMVCHLLRYFIFLTDFPNEVQS